MEKKEHVGDLHHYVFDLEKCGAISVYIQGELEKNRDGVVFLCVHDVGHSYLSMVDFVNRPDMEEVKRRCLFLHVIIPGQEPGAKTLNNNYVFPSLQDLGLNMVTILDLLRINQVVLLGEGAGANILLRFALYHSKRVYGLIAVNCAADANSNALMETIKGKFKRRGDSTLNKTNVDMYADTFKKRTELISSLQNLKVDVLLLVGMKSNCITETENIHRELKPGVCSMIKVEDVNDVLEDAAAKASDAIILFCQGQSLLPTAQRSMSRSNSRSSIGSGNGRKKSMSEYDQPNLRRLSLTSA